MKWISNIWYLNILIYLYMLIYLIYVPQIYVIRKGSYVFITH